MMNVGIIGTGFGGKIHLPGFRRIHGVDVVGIVGQNLEETRSFAHAQNVPRVFATWRELVHDPAIHAVSIVTPPQLHAEIAHEALKLKKAVLCEKPLAMNVQEAADLVKAATDAGVTNMVDFEFRAIPHFIALKKALDAKRIGAIRKIQVAWMTGGRAGAHIPFGWQNEKRSGGGALLNLGSHVLDYIEWLFGPIASVCAHLAICKPITDGTHVADADDTCDLLATLADGTPINVTISQVAYVGRGHLIDVYGERGTLRLENQNLKDAVNGFRLMRFGMDETDIEEITVTSFLETSSDGRLDAFTEIARRFIDGIRAHESPAPSFADGLRAQRILAAAQTSNETRQWVEV